MTGGRPILGACAIGLAMIAGCGARRVEYRPADLAPRVAGATEAQGGWAWPEVTVEGTGLTCRFPAQPHYDQRVGREDDGAFYRTRSARSRVPYGSFGVSVTEWEGGLVGDPLEAAASMADDVFATQHLRERRSQRLDIPGFYGREDTGLAQNGGFVALRQFVGRSRIYVAFAVVSNAPGPLSTAEGFMGSIRLDAEDALLPMGTGREPSPVFMPETDFAVRMPPLSARRTEDLEIGERTVPMQSFVAEGVGVRLRVRVIEVRGGADPELVAQIVAQLSLGQPGGPVSASGFPGTAYERTTGNVVVRGRVFVTAARVYVLEAATPPAPSVDPTVRGFFDSFRIL